VKIVRFTESEDDDYSSAAQVIHVGFFWESTPINKDNYIDVVDCETGESFDMGYLSLKNRSSGVFTYYLWNQDDDYSQGHIFDNGCVRVALRDTNKNIYAVSDKHFLVDNPI